MSLYSSVVGLGRNQIQHGRTIRRRNRNPTLSGLEPDVKGQIEPKLIQIKSQAEFLITHIDIDGMNAEIGVVWLRAKAGLIHNAERWGVGHGR